MARDRRAPAAHLAPLPRRRRDAVAESATAEEQCHPRKIFVGGLSHTTTTQDIRDYFSRYGTVVDAIALRWQDGRSRGFGYVTFSDAGAAAAVLRQSHKVDGRDVDVKRAVPGSNKLFVGGLPQNTTAAELRDHFEAFGVVSDAVVMMDPSTNRSRGFGFVCFLPGQEGAAAEKAALEQYDHHRLRGKWIEVKSAAPSHKLAGKEGLPTRCDGTPSTASSDGLSVADRAASSSPPTSATPAPPPGLFLMSALHDDVYGGELPPPPGLQSGDARCQQRQQPRQEPQLQQQRAAQKYGRRAAKMSDARQLDAVVPEQVQIAAVTAQPPFLRWPMAEMSPVAQPPQAVESLIADASAKGFFDASADLQRSLEQLLRLRCGTPAEIAKEANFGKPAAPAAAAPLGFFEGAEMSPMKVEW